MPVTEHLTIASFHEGLAKKKFSAREATQEYLKRIETRDSELGAFLAAHEETAIRAAEAVDAKIARGEEAGVLAGVPLALKDNMCVEGTRTTAASKILEHYTAAYDAHVVAKIKQAGAVILGKTNLDEFAMGSSTENSAFKVTKNPHDKTRVAGGSSGGSAAAVAADLAVAALGSDTGGSIRLPAAFCGVVGMKPTYGAVSRSGLIAMASSLDQIGPLAKTVEDAAHLFNAIRGYDARDATSVDHPYGKELLEPDFDRVKHLTVGIPKEYFIEGLSSDVRAGVERVIRGLEAEGVTFKPISMPHTKEALACYYIVQPAEVSSNLARFDGIRYARDPRRAPQNLHDLYLAARGKGFGAEPKRRIILGAFVLSSGYYDAYYGKAQAARALVAEDFTRAFEEVDAVISPVCPTKAFKIGEKTDDPLAMYLSDVFTIPANLAGLPGISIPVRDEQGLPAAFQLIGKHLREEDILGIGRLYEERIK